MAADVRAAVLRAPSNRPWTPRSESDYEKLCQDRRAWEGSDDNVWNVPNTITLSRLVGSIVLFTCIHTQQFAVAVAVFVIVSATDWLDGFLARRYNLITQLGRILDPFADKMLVCGTFVFLVAIPSSGVAAWMAVLVLGRELLITALRSFLETQSADFSASWSGKVKMVLQIAALLVCLLLIAWFGPAGEVPATWQLVRWGLLIAAMVITAWSGAIYIHRAGQIMSGLTEKR